MKLFRHEKGWSQEKIALEAGIDRTYLPSIEKGERNVSITVVEKLAIALGVEIKCFFDDSIKLNEPMNTIAHCTVEYITPNKTIETISFDNTDRQLYIYNYKGNHFRVFTELLSLISFFEYGVEPEHTFLTDEEVDDFILSYSFSD